MEKGSGITHRRRLGSGSSLSVVKKDGGVAIAVFDKSQVEKWGRAYQFVQDGRVSNLLSASYSEQADLSNFLGMAVRKLATDIAIAGGTYQG